MPSNKKIFDKLVSRVKIYLVIIAVLLTIICISNINLVLPAILFYILVVGYAYWSSEKRKEELSEHIEHLTFSVDKAAKGSAICLDGEVEAETQMGYLPFVQDRYIGQFVVDAFTEQSEIKTLWNNKFISAAGDIGDLSFMVPCIQIGYSGFAGTIHGDDFKDEDPEMIYEIFPRFVAKSLEYMSGKIDKSKLYKKSFREYEECINSIIGK